MVCLVLEIIGILSTSKGFQLKYFVVISVNPGAFSIPFPQNLQSIVSVSRLQEFYLLVHSFSSLGTSFRFIRCLLERRDYSLDVFLFSPLGNSSSFKEVNCILLVFPFLEIYGLVVRNWKGEEEDPVLGCSFSSGLLCTYSEDSSHGFLSLFWDFLSMC